MNFVKKLHLKARLDKKNKKLVMLDRTVKIYVAGHRGLVGSAIWNNLNNVAMTIW